VQVNSAIADSPAESNSKPEIVIGHAFLKMYVFNRSEERWVGKEGMARWWS